MTLVDKRRCLTAFFAGALVPLGDFGVGGEAAAGVDALGAGVEAAGGGGVGVLGVGATVDFFGGWRIAGGRCAGGEWIDGGPAFGGRGGPGWGKFGGDCPAPLGLLNRAWIDANSSLACCN